MPTLCFDDTFNRIERCILLKTFRKNCEDQRMAAHDATMEMRRAELGATHRGVLHTLGERYYMVGLNDQMTFRQYIRTLGHESVHLHQIMRGDLVQGEDRVFWHGKEYPAHIITDPDFYPVLPWEIEARAKQDTLYYRAVARLTPEEKAHVNTIDANRAEPAIDIDQLLAMLTGAFVSPYGSP